MTKLRKANAVFLAAVLFAGTFALISPSFIGGAEAYPDYGGMDNNKYKSKYSSYKPDKYDSKDSNLSIKKIKCNNVNLNVNDLSVNIGRPQTGDFTSLDTSSETGDQGITANNFANGERNNNNGFKKDKDGFVYVCINNNNNAGQGGADGDGEPKTCEECFADISPELRTAIEEVLDAGPITIPGTDIQLDFDSIEDLCRSLDEQPLRLTEDQIEAAIDLFVGNNQELEDEVRALVECLIDVGAIIVEPPPTCLECFAERSTEFQNAVNQLLAGGSITLPTVPPTVIQANSIATLCAALDQRDDLPLEITQEALNNLIQQISLIPQIGPIIAGEFDELVDCLEEAGILEITASP